MERIYYLKFLGARVYQEKGTVLEKEPWVVAYGSKVFDCNERAWRDGIRPQDSIRQAKITSPLVQIHSITDPSGKNLTRILDDFSSLTPFLEPHSVENGVFLNLSGEGALKENLPSSLIEWLQERACCFFTSIGIAETKFLAKVASSWAMEKYIKGAKLFSGKKEWGDVYCDKRYVSVNISEGRGKSYLKSLPLSYLLDDSFGISADTLSILYSLGLKTLGDVQKAPLYDLTQVLGDHAHLIKTLSEAKDFARVKAFCAPQSITKTITGEFPLSLVSLSLLEDTLQEMWEPLERQGLGFSNMKMVVCGNFPGVQAEKDLLYTVSHFETVKNILRLLLDQIVNEISRGKNEDLEYLASSCTISFSGIQKVLAKTNALFQEPLEEIKETLASTPFKKTYRDIRKKYGERALAIGVSRDLRREQMLSFWDPIRAGAILGQKTASN